MDAAISALFDAEAGDWVNSLPAYQQRSITSMLESRGPVDVAAAWLNAVGPSDTAEFGAIRRGKNLFFENLLTEVRTLLCTDRDYITERQGLLRSAKTGKTAFLMAICTAIEPRIGASAIVLAPAMSMVFTVIGKAGKDSACAVLEELIMSNKEGAQKRSLTEGADGK